MTLTQSSTKMWTTVVGLTLFATDLGMIVAGDRVLASDIEFSRWVQQWNGSVAEQLYRLGDLLGSTMLASFAAVAGIFVAAIMRHRPVATFLMVTMGIRLLATQLKPLFESPRPTVDHVRLLEHFDGSGYPSGHSTTAAMIATIIVILAWTYLEAPRWRWFTTSLAIGIILLVGWSRIWAGAHWPTDVLGGWSYGIALTLLAWLLTSSIIPRIMTDDFARSAKG